MIDIRQVWQKLIVDVCQIWQKSKENWLVIFLIAFVVFLINAKDAIESVDYFYGLLSDYFDEPVFTIKIKDDISIVSEELKVTFFDKNGAKGCEQVLRDSCDKNNDYYVCALKCEFFKDDLSVFFEISNNDCAPKERIESVIDSPNEFLLSSLINQGCSQ